MSAEIVGNSEYFLNALLSRPASSIPKGSLWAVFFDDIGNKILPAIVNAYEREPQSASWKTENAAAIILSPSYQETKGCMFCTALSIQGEGANVTTGGTPQGSYLRSYVGGGRQDLSKMRMSFLDTNVSFVDTILRGWALATACYGMVARTGYKNYRTNITCYKFGVSPTGPFVLQTVTFYDACCIDVSQEEYNYDPVTTFGKREAQFVYQSYSIDSETGNSILKVDNNNVAKRPDLIAPTGTGIWTSSRLTK